MKRLRRAQAAERAAIRAELEAEKRRRRACQLTEYADRVADYYADHADEFALALEVAIGGRRKRRD